MPKTILGIPIKTDRVPSALWTRLLRSPVAWFAAGLGSGFSPLAPGTMGSLVGLVSFVPLARLPLTVVISGVVVVTIGGIIAADHVARLLQMKDPGVVVIDEVVGMWITLLGVPPTPASFVLGFLLFRFMDVVKPWPARRLEALPSGWGIMADDVMAGLYANVALRLVSLWLPL
jgi:phosphatidylglycerophosphatase A